MKVEICSLDNGSGMTSKLRVYKHHFRDIFNTQPYCDIEEDNFIECCKNPDLAVAQMEKGKTIFDVSLHKLDDLCIKLFR
jgi:hypothetical protein